MKKKDKLISLAIIAASGLVLLYYSQRKGFVGINAGGADAELHLRSNWFTSARISTDTKPAAIGSRIYRPQSLSLSMRQNGHTWRIESRGPWGNLSKIKVRNNEATALRLGPPFLIKPQVKQKGSIHSINYVIFGQAGEQYHNFIKKITGPSLEQKSKSWMKKEKFLSPTASSTAEAALVACTCGKYQRISKENTRSYWISTWVLSKEKLKRYGSEWFNCS